ncbi:putative membrane protein [Dysgonomonas hofstadii]|uniref:Putative membrane protein n=1 Tax=Dysgonomonas hofstadii TaxID=637886 RepID=A0A840CZ38_9BACT|nr:hypothetical protein [Dysgonomonas hofstadii]MBB4037213.1 putative membrane protein [Dysgonomonas hofstadii]
MEIKKLKPQAAKILKMFHIFFAFCWIIGGVTLCLLIFITYPESGDELYMRSRILQIVDDYFIIYGASGAFLTGLIYSIWTNWGFFKHPWIIVKWIMTILQIIFGTFVLGPCINNNVVIAGQLRDAAFTDPVFLENIQTTQIWGTVQTILLLAVIAISVQKPWKKKKSEA